jgi:hypothetical protein
LVRAPDKHCVTGQCQFTDIDPLLLYMVNLFTSHSSVGGAIPRLLLFLFFIFYLFI